MYLCFAWIGHSTLDNMTMTICHELAENLTDPTGDGWRFDFDYQGSDWVEVGDVCSFSGGRVKGVAVQGYWAKDTNACVIPQCPDVVSGVSRDASCISLFG